MRWTSLRLAVVLATLLLASSSSAAPKPSVRFLSHTRSVTAGGVITATALITGPAKRCVGTLSVGTVASQRNATVVNHRATFRWSTPASTSTAQAAVTVSCRGSGAASFRVGIVGRLVPATVVVGKSGFSSVTYDFTTDRDFNYGAVLTNPSPDQDALDVQVTANFLAANGQIVATSVDTVSDVPAGSTFFYGGIALGSTVNAAPATLQLTTLVGSVQRAAHLPSVAVTNLRVIPDDSGNAEVQGQFTNPFTETLPSFTAITYVIFDSGGNVLSGGSTFADAEVPPGGLLGFDDTDGSLAASNAASVSATVSPNLS